MEQTTETNFISPYSYVQHNWKLKWNIIPSNKKYDRPNENRNQKEEKALEAIATVGVIGGLQLRTLFNISKQRLKSMRERHLIERHILFKNDREIPIYTIGKYGANRVMPQFEENYWVELNTLQVLKCLSFFQFCHLFHDPEIIPAPEPFTAGIRIKQNVFYIYVERKGIKDLLLYLKWKKSYNERIFVITERIDNIKELEVFMESDNPLMLRVILDEQLKRREIELYHYDKNSPKKWIK